MNARAAKINHLLRVLNSANQRTRHALSHEDELRGVDRHRRHLQAEHTQSSALIEHFRVRLAVVTRGDGVEDEVQRIGGGGDGGFGVHRDEMFRAERFRLGFLRVRSRDGRDLGAEGRGDFDAHHTQAPHTRDADARAGLDAESLHWIVQSDSSAQERRRLVERRIIWNLNGEAFVHHHLRGVTTNRLSSVRSRATVRGSGAVRHRHPVVAILFLVGEATFTVQARIDHEPDADLIAHLEFSHVFPHLVDDARQFVSRNEGIRRRA